MIGGRFINAFAAGVFSSFLLLAYLAGNSTLFLIEGVLVIGNLAIYFHQGDN